MTIANPAPTTAKTSTERVQAALEAAGIGLSICTYPASTRTAADAAAAIGCAVGQIVKSLIFRANPSGLPVLVLASGANRVDEARITAALAETHAGETLGKADAAFVRQVTGFAIGGVAPVGHLTPPITFIDADLQRYPQIWAAAGSPNTVFALSFLQLQHLTGGKMLTISDETVAAK